jgi:hypothetical protein
MTAKKCNLCGDNVKKSHTVYSRYNLRDIVCGKCSYAEKMLDIRSYCVNAEGKTPEECKIDEGDWRAKVLQTRINTDQFLVKQDIKKE